MQLVTGNVYRGASVPLNSWAEPCTRHILWGISYEWPELSRQDRLTRDVALPGTAARIPALGLVLGLSLVLVAQYESRTLPLAIVAIVPMSILAALTGVWLSRQPPFLQPGDLNIFTQVALVVLVGLACKNAILIVEFAKDLEETGKPLLAATIEAARLRLRPILMTSIAFCAGVVPLIVSSGAGSEMRRAMGVAVFSGMLGVTLFGIFLTPLFYMLLRLSTARRRKQAAQVRAECDASAHPYHPGEEPAADKGPVLKGYLALREAEAVVEVDVDVDEEVATQWLAGDAGGQLAGLAQLEVDCGGE